MIHSFKIIFLWKNQEHRSVGFTIILSTDPELSNFNQQGKHSTYACS